MVLMVYSGAGGTLIYEKNLKSKFSCQTPFKLLTPKFCDFLAWQAVTTRPGQCRR
jgi:hypothetical protein